jgi:hypothetical protein
MSTISYELKREANGNCIISGEWNGSASSFQCEIDKSTGDNDSANFLLKIDGIQIEKGEIRMRGTLERQEFIETLELILSELKG